MNEILVVFASATTVARVRKMLKAKNFKSRILQTPKILSEDGCSFAIISAYEAADEIKLISEKLGVIIKAIYLIDGDSYRLIEKR